VFIGSLFLIQIDGALYLLMFMYAADVKGFSFHLMTADMLEYKCS
jgi:hypothetical protein